MYFLEGGLLMVGNLLKTDSWVGDKKHVNVECATRICTFCIIRATDASIKANEDAMRGTLLNSRRLSAVSMLNSALTLGSVVQLWPQPIPDNETARLQVARHSTICSTEIDPTMNLLVNIVARTLECPTAFIGIMDESLLWIKASVGLDDRLTHMPRDGSICAHTLSQDATMIVNDTSVDKHFHAGDHVVGSSSMCYYAGTPIRVRGHCIGVVCALDVEPHSKTTDAMKSTLEAVANIVSELGGNQTLERELSHNLLERLSHVTAPRSFQLTDAFALKNADIKNARAASVKFLASGYRQLLTLPTSKELACALSLTASQLAPAYEGVELRFGIKSFMRFLKQLEKEQEGEDGGETQSLEMLLATYPDYGQATEALLDSGRIAVPVLEDEEIEPLSIRAVHEQLMAIAKDEGAGGVARKQLLALRLLQKCRYPEERMFIVRMLAHQSLRIGMGEKSILAALASASFPSFDNRVGENDGVAGSDSLVQEKDWVEAVTLAYAQHPNYHTLAELLHADQQEENIAEKIRLLRNQARPITGVPVLTMSAYPVTSVAAVLDRVSKAKSRTATCEYKNLCGNGEHCYTIYLMKNPDTLNLSSTLTSN
ncbi:hypothetical protein G195_003354 [Phytophthora kernoviae 00238/432]|uniref:GAF domain-containing protein n=2 Tax=Phytophthora kernoviae TaxID=325452 RepID=A0A8T0M7H7_9STRA|nr:hypothetical protein G195_003354 [Phytophthora kernoviae 00238/432]KAG2529318.1 hypothetical protein JM16_001826 [Phytophthora kernoviae]